MRKSLSEFIHRYPKITFLTGAGISTDSGIPDYRGPNGVYVRNKDYKPIQYQQFVSSHEFRQRYWARSFLGWPRISSAKPNQSHYILAKFQQRFPQTRLLTQNVDGLHSISGFKDVVEMHGTLHKVKCLGCEETVSRLDFQDELAKLNPQVVKWAKQNPDKIDGDVSSSVNPDGDVEIAWDYSDFMYPECSSCKGIYKPDVVFFGENMNHHVRDQTFEAIDNSECLIVAGSSLTVYSALRIVKHAHDTKKPICVINLGETRGDSLATIVLNEKLASVLEQLDPV
ncbi:NAD-dependent protein lipoamidase sirtuin-4 [Terramyces sp. JEL0728]|nr:NAD-dependent protein lipoamidase sirtuin-4 [Terramyces sp. JEL0728]